MADEALLTLADLGARLHVRCNKEDRVRTGATFTVDVELVSEKCCVCGMVFAMTADFQRRRREKRDWFYCPAGHHQHYTAENEAEKMRRERDQARQQIARAEQEARDAWATAEDQRKRALAAKAETTRLKKRAGAGVCPCCNRTFASLARHMASKHPDVAPPKPALVARTA